MAWIVDWAVSINGRDVSTPMRPYITDISVTDRDGTASDDCRVTFDDAKGLLLLPEPRAKIAVTLQGVVVFEGIVDSTPWTLTRGGGRILEISAKGRDTRGQTKARQRWHLDDATLREALEKGAKDAGLSGVVVDPELGAIKLPYWSPDGSSFVAWASRLAADYGATFKVRGDRAVFAKRGAGLSASGSPMPVIEARVPGNVISCNLDPVRGRDRYAKARVRFFDRETAEFKFVDADIEASDEDEADIEAMKEGASDLAELVSRFDAADEGHAKARASRIATESKRESGGGTIEMSLQPEAQAEGTLILTGARAGIDGTYRITSVTHKATRSGGATTTLEVRQPQGAAGKDDRRQTSEAA